MLSTLCLNMIVKDEAHVIRRCLDSVRSHLANWTIVDTGSTDGTQAIIRSHLRDLPGELHERPWRDFGTNRSEAIALARGKQLHDKRETEKRREADREAAAAIKSGRR